MEHWMRFGLPWQLARMSEMGIVAALQPTPRMLPV